jgi:hypothetical protein
MFALHARRHDPCANTGPAAWLGQPCPKQFDRKFPLLDQVIKRVRDLLVRNQFWRSHALLPMAGIAAAVKAGDDQEIGLNEEKERVGKFLRARPTESRKDGGELPRIVSHASNDAVDFGAEATA